MFIRYSGQTKPEYYPKTGSTVFANGSAITPDGAGAFQPASTGEPVTAVIMTNILSTDADFAANTKELCDDVTNSEDVFQADVEVGTLTAALVGTYVNLNSATGIDVTASTNKDVFIVGYISPSVALIKFNKTSVVNG